MAAPKNALAPLDRDEPVVATTVETPGPAAQDLSDREAHMNKYKRQEAYFKTRPRVKVRVPEDTTVMINSYPFYIAGKTTVEVPVDVYDLLAEAGRI